MRNEELMAAQAAGDSVSEWELQQHTTAQRGLAGSVAKASIVNCKFKVRVKNPSGCSIILRDVGHAHEAPRKSICCHHNLHAVASQQPVREQVWHELTRLCT